MSPIEDTVVAIRAHHRSARFAMKQIQRMERALEAHICHDYVGLSHDADEKTRKAAWAETKRLIAECRFQAETQALCASAISPLIQATARGCEPWVALRKEHEKAMEKLAQELPIWVSWAGELHGFGSKGLAQIIGEAGDLSKYATVSKLWKRLGLAVMDGKRQGSPGKGASAETWTAHGYSPERRSIMWNIAASLFKAQSQRSDKETGEIKREAGTYRAIYDARKVYELPRTQSDGHAHNRAMRYMEKMFIADLWSAWREADTKLKPIEYMPSSDLKAA